MFSINFWRDATERAVSTAAQVFVALYVIGAGGVVPGFNDLTHAAIAAGVAAGLSVVKALAGSQVGDGSPSLLPSVSPKLPPPLDEPIPAGPAPMATAPVKAKPRKRTKSAGHVDSLTLLAVVSVAALVLVLLVIFGVLTG